MQLDGAKLVSINDRDEHTFIVKWLAVNAKQGCVSFCISTFCSLFITAAVSVFSQFAKSVYFFAVVFNLQMLFFNEIMVLVISE